MPIYTIAQYQVRPSGVNKVSRAIKEFVPHVCANERGTRMYVAWRQEDEPTKFVHFFIFDGEPAHAAHRSSVAVKQFEAVYAAGPVVFTDYNQVATSLCTIRHSVQIDAKPEAIWPLVAKAPGFRQWWT